MPVHYEKKIPTPITIRSTTETFLGLSALLARDQCFPRSISLDSHVLKSTREGERDAINNYYYFLPGFLLLVGQTIRLDTVENKKIPIFIHSYEDSKITIGLDITNKKREIMCICPLRKK